MPVDVRLLTLILTAVISGVWAAHTREPSDAGRRAANDPGVMSMPRP